MSSLGNAHPERGRIPMHVSPHGPRLLTYEVSLALLRGFG